MVPPTKTHQDDGKVIDATGRFGGSDLEPRSEQADEPEVCAPRQVAAQLMVPADRPMTEHGRDDYFADLLSGRPVRDESNGAPRKASTSSKRRELDQFFEDAIESPLRATPAQPPAAGSASLQPRAINQDRVRRRVSLRWVTAAGTAALALTGLLVTTPMWSQHDRRGQSPGPAGAATRVAFLDPVVLNTENAAQGITQVSFRRQPRRTVPHRQVQRHHPRQTPARTPEHSTFVASATSVPVSSASTESTAHQQSSTAPTERSSSQASTVATAGTTHTTKPSASTAKRPAFGQAGVLGPGHSPDS